MAKALILVDIQNDFCEGGSLAVAGGASVAEMVTEYVEDHLHEYDAIVATKDYHINPGSHFADNPDYVDTWPQHCISGTPGAEFHPNLRVSPDAIFYKGRHSAAYSGFEAATPTIWNEEQKEQTLNDWLQERGIVEVDVVGIATDYCVKATALDAVKYGYDTTVLTDLVAAVNPVGSGRKALEEMERAGVMLRESTDV